MLKISISMVRPCKTKQDKADILQTGKLDGFSSLRTPDLRTASEKVAVMFMSGGPEDISFSALEDAMAAGWRFSRIQLVDDVDIEIVQVMYCGELQSAAYWMDQVLRIVQTYPGLERVYNETKAAQAQFDRMFQGGDA